MKAIVCVDKNFGIGRGTKLPWKNKEDMRFFREYTWGQNILMGRKTYGGLGVVFLPNRSIYVLTKNANGCMGTEIDTWPASVLFTNLNNIPKNIIICGGREIYEQFLPNCDELMITKLEESYDCDIFFPYSEFGLNKIFNKKELVKEIEGGKIWKYYN